MEQQFTFYDILFLTLYGGVTFTAMVACCYLLLRRANAFAPEITSPVRLRRWTAFFFAAIAISHVWWILSCPGYPIDPYSLEAIICTGLDMVVLLGTILCIMLVMLQDRRRPLWLAGIAVVLALADLLLISIAGPEASTIHLVLFFLLLIYIAIIMGHAVKQYGRWLRDNYADLEHKEVWQSIVVLALFMLSSVIYTVLNKNFVWEIIIQVYALAMIFFLLWRVETLQTLEELTADPSDAPTPVFAKIELLLKRHCVDTQLYLQQDVSITQLAQLIGTNRTYLSKYFARQGMTYNTYINGLRIDYFVLLYQKATADHRIFTVRDLAFESGFRSYSTFSSAFKQFKGMTITVWMRDYTEWRIIH